MDAQFCAPSIRQFVAAFYVLEAADAVAIRFVSARFLEFVAAP